jgi:hypothetical protein
MSKGGTQDFTVDGLKDFAKACVGEGWHQLVEDLIDDLIKLGWNRSIHQVKEKFGGLRFYIGGGSDPIFDRIDIAEEESLKICENCGKPGMEHAKMGWIYTLCTVCAEEEK